MIQNEEFIQEFVEEASSHVNNVESELLKIETSTIDLESINSIFRSVHSIKGTAGFFGLSKIVTLAHAMENIFGKVRNDRLKISNHEIDRLLSANDHLRALIEDVYKSEKVEISEHIKKLTVILEGKKVFVDDEKKYYDPYIVERQMIQDAARHGHHIYKVKLKVNQNVSKKEIDSIGFLKKIESIGTIIYSYTDIFEIYSVFVFTTVLEKKLLPLALDISLENIQELDGNIDIDEMIQSFDQYDELVKEEIVKPENEKIQDEKKHNTSNGEDSIKVQVSLLNELLNLASEMVLARNQLLRSIDSFRKSVPGINPILQNVDRITTELQEKIMHTRMQPIGNVFDKFPRIIRDLSKKLNKSIELKLEGRDVELDKSIIESLADPLTHLVRNAVDHGIEYPQERQKNGKQKTGKIIMKAYHEAGCVNIDIIDDGKGINKDIIVKKIVEKELVNKAEMDLMGEQDILQFIFNPGFSTADEVTDVSGRGVGMDVVKTNIKKLGGTIEVNTVVGKGTTFRLIMPLTLAIIYSLIVEVKGLCFALPQVNLQEIVRIKPNDASKKIEYINNAEVLRLRGKLLPIIYLSDILGLDKLQKDREKKCKKIQRILVLKLGNRCVGLVVDKIYDEEEILVKPLPKYLKDCKSYSGVTILGDGKPSLILDIDGIVTKAGLRFNEEDEKNDKIDLFKEKEDSKEYNNLLIFKCSGEEILAVDLSLISRVEKINRRDIERIGENGYIKYRGDSLRVINLEEFLPISKGNDKGEHLYVIIPKLVKHPVGILIEKIYDTIQTRINLNQENIKVRGLIGSTILNDRIVLLINTYELLEIGVPEYYHVQDSNKIGEKRTVLVVEDTPFFAKVEKDYLEWAGYEVAMASNGKEGLDILREKKIDAVISDIQMPVMDGYTFAKAIREDEKLSDLPLIAVTSMADECSKNEGLEAGFDYYECKLDKENLLSRLKNVLNI
ncbi:chemotaxis protein CheW [Lutibacter sp. B2]|nr:chemotaxis protein CheW [Lutibacter sp. B2]